MYTQTNLVDIFNQIKPDKDLALDTETIGKYGKIRLVQFYQRDWEKVLLVDYPNPIELLLMLIKLKDTNLVMQYSIYDISTIQRQSGGKFVPNKFEDTFLLARLALPQLQSFSLDSLLIHIVGKDMYAEHGLSKAQLQKSNWSAPVLTSNQLLYASIDTYYLLDVYDYVKPHIAGMSYKLDKLALRCALDFQRNGLPVDRERLVETYEQNIKELENIQLPINCNSYVQVRPYIGSAMSDGLGLATLAIQGNKKAAMVKRARALTKQNSFLNKFDTDDGRVYGHFSPAARSGRFTCDDQNLQQIPRLLKHCFGYKKKDNKVLIYSDYSQLELRCAAALTGDFTMCDKLKAGKDLHNFVAEMTFGPDWTKEERFIAKTENFNLLYGGGVNMLQSIIIQQAGKLIPIETLTILVKRWKELFPGIVKWHSRGIRDHKKGLLGSTPVGRRYRGRMMTDQINIQNQGFGAEVAKLALHYMYKNNGLSQFEAKLINFVHDSYIIEMPKDNDFRACCKHVAEAMKNSWAECVKLSTVPVKNIPMPIEVRVGLNWGEIEKNENIIYTLLL